MRRVIVFLLGLFVMTAPSLATERDDALDLYESVCSRCHELDGYVWERSFKAWQASVSQMQQYNGTNDFSDADARSIVDFLTENGGRLEREYAGWDFEEGLADPANKPLFSHAAMDRAGRVSGYVGVAFFLVAVGSGAARRRAKRFSLLHHLTAYGTLVFALLHSAYYAVTIGMPSLFWLRMGVAATGVLVIAGLSGFMRRRLKRLFIKIHISFALIGLVAVAVHWAWIYI